jgi:Mrp family chromosome partitioning ATPase
VPVLGLVENMSSFKCPDCGKVHEVFGPSKAAEMAAAHGIGAVASVPIDPALAAAVDAGTVELADVSFMKPILDALV